MLHIQPIKTPDIYPSLNGIKSSGGRTQYDPELWEFQYEINRYLLHATESEVRARHESILKNMKFLINEERHIIPIHNFLSSWYWYRKEHQTRYEYYLRKLTPCLSVPKIDYLTFDHTKQKRINESCKILFRYDKLEFIKRIVDEGSIRIRPASVHLKMESDKARHDNELEKDAIISGSNFVIKVENRKLPAKGPLRRIVSAPNYYLFCMSYAFNRAFFEEFKGADSYIVIHDKDAFTSRLEEASSQVLHGWYFYENPVIYYDPYEMTLKDALDAGAFKHFAFAYQQEYRFLWIHTGGLEADDDKYLRLGSLKDIAEFHLQ